MPARSIASKRPCCRAARARSSPVWCSPSAETARVQIADPPVEAKVPGVDAAPGSTVRLRLVAASIADGTVAFVPIGAESSSEQKVH
ncbi:MAG: hypothetical protein U0Q04_05610 [Microbacterium sp.]